MSELAYTVGEKCSYDHALIEAGRNEQKVQKEGRSRDFEGGQVWKTQQEAELFIEDNFLTFTPDVYGVWLENGWDKDVDPSPGKDGVHRLLVSSDLRLLPEKT